MVAWSELVKDISITLVVAACPHTFKLYYIQSLTKTNRHHYSYRIVHTDSFEWSKMYFHFFFGKLNRCGFYFFLNTKMSMHNVSEYMGPLLIKCTLYFFIFSEQGATKLKCQYLVPNFLRAVRLPIYCVSTWIVYADSYIPNWAISMMYLSRSVLYVMYIYI